MPASPVRRDYGEKDPAKVPMVPLKKPVLPPDYGIKGYKRS